MFQNNLSDYSPASEELFSSVPNFEENHPLFAPDELDSLLSLASPQFPSPSFPSSGKEKGKGEEQGQEVTKMDNMNFFDDLPELEAGAEQGDGLDFFFSLPSFQGAANSLFEDQASQWVEDSIDFDAEPEAESQFPFLPPSVPVTRSPSPFPSPSPSPSASSFPSAPSSPPPSSSSRSRNPSGKVQKASKKKAKSSSPPPSEQDSVMSEQEKKERNKAAAQKYRSRLKEEAQENENMCRLLHNENLVLAERIRQEKLKIQELRSMLVRHGLLPSSDS